MDTDWDVNAILGHIKRNGVVYYLVKWGASEEPEHMLNHCPEKIKQYWDSLLRDSTVSSTSSAPEVLEFTEFQKSSTLQSTIQDTDATIQNTDTTMQNTDDTIQDTDTTIQNTDTTIQNTDSTIQNKDTNQVSVQSQTDTNQKKQNQNLPNKLKRIKRKQMQKQTSQFCHPCSKSFFNAGSLKRHQREIHNSNIRFKCNTCETKFSRKKALKIHLYRCNFKKENLLYWKW